jgi:hypothetical protein
VVYLVFAVLVIGVLGGLVLLRHRHHDESSRSIDSFHRRLEALDQNQPPIEKSGRRR